MSIQINFHCHQPLQIRVNKFTDFAALDIIGENGNDVTYFIRNMEDVNTLLLGVAELARVVAELEAEAEAEKKTQEDTLETFIGGGFGSISTTSEDNWRTINCRQELD